MPVAPPSVLPPWLAAGNTGGTSTEGEGAGGDSTAPTVGRSSQAAAEQAEAELSPAEAELRELLQRSVSGLQPAAGSLETLRRAVPLRRVRRRRYSGVAGALVLGVLGGLVLHSLAGAGGLAQGSQSGPGYQNAATSSTAGSGSATPSANAVLPYPPPPPGAGGAWPTGSAAAAGAPSGGASGSRDNSVAPWMTGTAAPGSGSGGASAAECTRAQLGGGASTVGTAGADGTTYGSFQVANVSQTTCQVSLPGTVTVLSVSGTSASRIAVVPHSATDPATLLPAPAATRSPVLLTPGQAYAVDFAWVPATGTDAPSCADSSAPPTPTATATSGGGATDVASDPAGDDQGASSASSPPPTGQPTVTLVHTPGAGGPPAASAVLPGACAGTVYDTPPLATG